MLLNLKVKNTKLKELRANYKTYLIKNIFMFKNLFQNKEKIRIIDKETGYFV